MSIQSETNERLARIEEQLKGIRETLQPLANTSTQIALNRQDIDTLKECQRESKRFRWGWITAISAALISSIGALLATWFHT